MVNVRKRGIVTRGICMCLGMRRTFEFTLNYGASAKISSILMTACESEVEESFIGLEKDEQQ
jgi:hypothetical protein